MFRRSKNAPSSNRSRRASTASAGTEIATRGIVTIAICTGAAMWGYALINLATRA